MYIVYTYTCIHMYTYRIKRGNNKGIDHRIDHGFHGLNQLTHEIAVWFHEIDRTKLYGM